MAHWASYIGFGFEKEECYTLLKYMKNLLKEYEDKIAWHNPEYMHMTLQFLGWTKDSDVLKLKNILQKEKINNINLKLNGELILLGFESKKEYIAMKIETTNELKRYRETLGIKMKEQGIPFKEQEFLSHISLGRINGLESIENKKYFETITINPNGVYIYESIPESNILAGVKSKDLLIKNNDMER